MFALSLLLAAPPATPRPAPPAGPHIVFANGDRVPGRAVGGDENTVRFAADLGGSAEPWNVPLAQVKFLWFTDVPPDYTFDPARYPTPPADRKNDYLILRTGDARPGTAARFTAGGVDFAPGGAVPFAALDAFAPNPALVAPRRVKGDATRLITSTGARLTVTGYKAGERVTGTTAFGAKVDLPATAVVAADELKGVKYLSDLDPKVDTKPFLSVPPAWGKDATPAGKPLTVRTANGLETFDRGLGLMPSTTLTVAVPTKAKTFAALVGRDPNDAGRGTASVRILLDGKDATPKDLSPPRDTAVPVNVPVAGVKTLSLVVGFGPVGDLPAAVLWADAAFRE